MPVRHIHEMKPNVLVKELRSYAEASRDEYIDPRNLELMNEAANTIEFLSAELDSLQDLAAELDEPRVVRDTYPDEVDQS